jgi:hypothetical protein
VWNLGGINESEQNHFYLDGGTFEIYRTTISSFNNDKLRLLKCNNYNNEIIVSFLIYNNIKINESGYHFDLGGDTDISDSVYFIFLFSFFLLYI